MKYLFYAALFFQATINFSYCAYDWPHEVSDLEPDSRIVYGKLENGFRYVFMPNGQLPKHFAVRLYVDAGSFMEEEKERGLAHFLEHMAFKGIRGYPEDQMIQTLQRLGMPFGSHTNAHTSFDETVYKLDFVDNSSENLQHALGIMSGIADGMFLDEPLIKKEIGVILAEKRDSYSVGYKLSCDYMKFTANELRINERLPIGLESVIKSANTELLRNFYKKWYRPERMILVIIGDLDRNEAESAIKENFATFSDLLKAPEEPDLGVLKYKQGLRSRVYKDKELAGTSIELLSQKPYQRKVIDKKTWKRWIYESLAYRIFNERMEELAKQENFPFTAGACSTTVNYDLFTQSSISIECKPEQVFVALRTAENELRRVFDYGFTDEEFKRMKREKLYEYERAKDLDETQKTADLIHDLLETTIKEEIFTSNQWDYEFLKGFFENESDKEECLEVFKNSWDMENLLIYLYTNSDIKYTEDQLKEAYYTSKEIILEAPKERKALKYSYDGLGEKGSILDEHYNAELDCYQYRLSNNVRVNLKQTNYDKDEIFYQIHFGNGEDEPGTKLAAITKVASDIFYDGGIGALSNEELSRVFAGSGIAVQGINVGSDAFEINSSIKPADFEGQVNLICGSLMEPAYRSDRLKQMHVGIYDHYNNLNQTMRGIIYLEVNPYLTNGHPDYKPDRLEDLVARTPQEVKEWLKAALTESYIEISIVGDFDRGQVLESLLKTFGSLPKRRGNKQCYKDEQKIVLRKSPLKEVFSYYSTLPKANSLVYWELPDRENDNQFIINTVRASILSEILDERLRQKVRMELGEGYSPLTFIDFDGKAITAKTITDPEKANYLCELIAEIAETLAQEGATEDEFNRVIMAKLLDMESKKSTNWYWLNRLAQSQEYSHKTKLENFANNYYKKLKFEEVNEAAKEYLQAKKALKVMVVPDSHRMKVEGVLKD